MYDFEKAYKLVNEDLDCPKGCKVCEGGGVLFLPNEAEFLSKKLGLSKESFANLKSIDGYDVWGADEFDKHCPFYRFGRCVNREARPFDCRSYPAVPSLKGNLLKIELDPNCPLAKEGKITQAFLKKATKAWEYLSPPEWWLRIYGKF